LLAHPRWAHPATRPTSMIARGPEALGHGAKGSGGESFTAQPRATPSWRSETVARWPERKLPAQLALNVGVDLRLGGLAAVPLGGSQGPGAWVSSTSSG
jgi:hypothetical protein